MRVIIFPYRNVCRRLCVKDDPKFIYDIPMPDESDPCGFDPACDPDHPRCVTHEEVVQAYQRIKSGIRTKLSDEFGIDLYFKKDFLQYTSSFKERGARNSLLSLKEKKNFSGAIAASAGNHALALCHHGNLLDIPITVVMPITAPIIKIKNCVKLGSRVIVTGKNLAESKRYAMKIAQVNNAAYINGYDNPMILAGQGSIAAEIDEIHSDMEVIIVPVGGGGLIAGICAYYSERKNKPRIIAVESNRSDGWSVSYHNGKSTKITSKTTIADGLNVESVGVNSLETSLKYGVECYTLNEKYLSQAIVRLLESEKCVIEGAGAAGLAALIAGSIDGLTGKKVCILLTGGNVDTTVLCKIIERGLAIDGRLHFFEVVVPDTPGSIAAVTKLLQMNQVSIRDIMHERVWLFSEILSVRVKFIIETIDAEHAASVRQVIKENYCDAVWDSLV